MRPGLACSKEGGRPVRQADETSALLLGAFVLVTALPLSAGLTPEELRGRQIYRSGESPSGTPIVALVGTEDLELPATSLPCMSCHGRDGRGKQEGGISPSNLQWSSLTRPYSVPNASGRAHPPYTPTLVKRAITMGRDPAKQRLHVAMPRYRISMRDADDLVAYMARIGTDLDPGLTDAEITLGVLVPPTAEGNAIRETVAAWFERVNAGGGIYGRRVRLSDDREPFAIVYAQTAAGASDIEEMAATRGIPTIAPFRMGTGDTNRYLFALVAGVEEQSLALIEAAGTKVRIISDARTAGIAARLAAHSDPASRTILFLSNPDKLAALVRSGTAGTILIPAAFASDAIVSTPRATRILVAMPAAEVTRRGAAELDALTSSRAHRTPSATALAAAKLLTRALERAGREVDRETLVDILDTFQREPTELTPPVTWTSTRRVGSKECTVLRVTEGKLQKLP
ncbi:MAG TPA: c-type cytochrome [Thermoanaerobaculia bacterium]|nr:c-type cytochrome [Thermoanaerobaculia bacterium]